MWLSFYARIASNNVICCDPYAIPSGSPDLVCFLNIANHPAFHLCILPGTYPNVPSTCHLLMFQESSLKHTSNLGGILFQESSDRSVQSERVALFQRLDLIYRNILHLFPNIFFLKPLWKLVPKCAHSSLRRKPNLGFLIQIILTPRLNFAC